METYKQNPTQNYTGHGWEGKLHQSNLSTKEIAQAFRLTLKHRYPECKFSVTQEVFSGGASISIRLMEAPYDVFSTPDKRKAEEVARFPMTPEDILTRWSRIKENGHNEVNQFYIEEDYILNDKGREIMTFCKKLMDSYNYDDSDAMIDYFSTNFYENIGVGKWNKSFKIKQ